MAGGFIQGDKGERDREGCYVTRMFAMILSGGENGLEAVHAVKKLCR